MVIGESVQGEPIVARRFGAPDAAVRVVVIGEIHGNESAGRAVISKISEKLKVRSTRATFWLVTTMNPDGHAAGTRTNANGVDLNRNFPALWIPQGRGTVQYSGDGPGSESETAAMMAFLKQVKPTAVVVFHQPLDAVDLGYPRSHAAAKAFGRWMGMDVWSIPCGGRPCHGTLTDWVDARLKAVGLTVELSRAPDDAELERAANASIRLGTWLGQ
jgi:predicted deacylase